MRRRKLTRHQWRELLDQQSGSGLVVKDFCARHGVGMSALFAWRRRLAATPSLAFVELTTTLSDTTAPSPAIELLLPLGVAVRVREEFDVTTLRRVVEALS